MTTGWRTARDLDVVHPLIVAELGEDVQEMRIGTHSLLRSRRWPSKFQPTALRVPVAAGSGDGADKSIGSMQDHVQEVTRN